MSPLNWYFPNFSAILIPNVGPVSSFSACPRPHGISPMALISCPGPDASCHTLGGGGKTEAAGEKKYRGQKTFDNTEV